MKAPGASGRGGGSRARPAGGKEGGAGGACCGGCEREALLVDEFVIWDGFYASQYGDMYDGFMMMIVMKNGDLNVYPFAMV